MFQRFCATHHSATVAAWRSPRRRKSHTNSAGIRSCNQRAAQHADELAEHPEQRVPDLMDRDVEAVEPTVAFGVQRQHDPVERKERRQGEPQAALHLAAYLDTSSATSTRPNGALTCTPCTAPFTCRNISRAIATPSASAASFPRSLTFRMRASTSSGTRSEEHTSELQSRLHLVCRLLLEKKKKRQQDSTSDDTKKSTH